MKNPCKEVARGDTFGKDRPEGLNATYTLTVVISNFPNHDKSLNELEKSIQEVCDLCYLQGARLKVTKLHND
jgi:hypothetical protein